MEWAPLIAIVVSVVSAFIALLQAQRAKDEADRAVAVEERRQVRRQIIADAMDAGSRLLETLVVEHRDGLAIGAHDHRILEWYNTAHKAVVEADRPQLGRLHKPLGEMKPIAEVAERLTRLQEILDRL